jgi:hypothetical protein
MRSCADRNNHLKIVALAPVGATTVVLVGITPTVADGSVTIATGTGVMLWPARRRSPPASTQ